MKKKISCETPPYVIIIKKKFIKYWDGSAGFISLFDCWASRIGGPRSMSICDSGCGLNNVPSFSHLSECTKLLLLLPPIVSTNEFRWSHYCDWIGAAPLPLCLNGESPQAIRTQNAHENTFYFIYFFSNLPPSADGKGSRQKGDMCTLIIRAHRKLSDLFFYFFLLFFFSPGKFENIKRADIMWISKCQGPMKEPSRCGCCYGRRSARLPYRIGRAVSLPFLSFFWFWFWWKNGWGRRKNILLLLQLLLFFFSRRERVCYTFYFLGSWCWCSSFFFFSLFF